VKKKDMVKEEKPAEQVKLNRALPLAESLDPPLSISGKRRVP